ncbi:MAG: FkbM family methyltransferase [Gammaproteobacteria bacterium]
MIDIKLLRYLTAHPLNRRTRFRSILPIVCWSIATRLVPGCQFIVPFANNARLVVTPGRWGSEANALCGLHEFNDMGFLLHFLRSTDLFCDIGANIGAYTVLASAGIGARSLAFEPIESSYAELRKNVDVNQIAELVDARRMGVGKALGKLTLTSQKDTMNHVVMGTATGPNETVDVDTLDRALAGRMPALLKVDVEGWEHEVLQGAASTLRHPDLLAVIIELNQSGNRYGFSDEDIHQTLINHGFSSHWYKPFERQLIDLGGKYNASGNTLYVRNSEIIGERLRNAPPFRVRDFYI